jgi:hypothetical protein
MENYSTCEGERLYPVASCMVSAMERVNVCGQDPEIPSSITSRNAATDAAGVNIGSLRQYFAIKLALVDAIMRRHRVDMLGHQLLISGQCTIPEPIRREAQLCRRCH